jgi:hypothetical protein
MTRATGRMLTTVERLELAQCLLVRRLGCGCEVGLYQTMAGHVLTVVDNPDDDCPDRGHQADFVIVTREFQEPARTAAHGEAA